MRKLYYILVLFGILLNSCDKNEDDEVFASGKTPDWRAVKDLPGLLNQLRYKIYKEYDVSVAINDTLGWEFRGFNSHGDSIIHYEVLTLGYTMEGEAMRTVGRTLSKDTAALIKALELIEKYVAPRLPKSSQYRPYVYLLCDTTYIEYTTYYGKIHHPKWTMKASILCEDIGMVSQILEMNDREQRFWAGMVLARNHYMALYNTYEEDLQDFFSITVDEDDNSLYGKMKIFSTGIIPDNQDSIMYASGFLMDDYRGRYHMGASSVYKNWKVVQYLFEQSDVQTYMAAVYAFEEEEFEAMLGGKFDKILEKYRFMKKLLKKFRAEIAP